MWKARLRSGLLSFTANLNAASRSKNFARGENMPKSAQTKELSPTHIFGAVLPDLAIETILDRSDPTRLRLHTWEDENPRQHQPLAIAVANIRLLQFQPGFLVRFVFQVRARHSEQPRNSLPPCEVLERLLQSAARCGCARHCVRSSSWFTDCFPVAPTLYLLGPENEASPAAPGGVSLPPPYFVE